MASAIVTFTARGPDRIIAEGGSQAWRLDPLRAGRAEYLVCCQNRTDGEWGGATEPHGAAFLVGRISGLLPATDADQAGRHLIRIDAFARIAVPRAWRGWRYPVRYTTLEELGIDLAQISFQPMPGAATAPDEEERDDEAASMTVAVAAAKDRLARQIGIPASAIEITIRL